MSKLTQIALGTFFLIVTSASAQQKPAKETANVSGGGIFDEYDSSRSIKSRNESLEAFAEYLVKIGGVDPNRIEIIDGGHCEKWKIQLWFYAREAPGKPTAFRCLDPKQVRIIRKRAQEMKRERASHRRI
jgi:hypothetical protein